MKLNCWKCIILLSAFVCFVAINIIYGAISAVKDAK